MPYPKAIDTEKPTVFVGGIPKTADTKVLREYIRSVNSNCEFHLVTDSKNRSRGFAFILCATEKEAHEFANQRHMYDNKVLDCKVSLHHTDYITSSLNNIREPKKIFVDKIAKRVTKSDLEKSFMVYGEIEEIILIEKEKRSINFAYISYFDTESARRCVQGPEIKYSAGSKLSVIFARPKFSKKMLLDIPPLLKEYIRQIQKGLKEYDPKDFVNLHVEVVNDFSTRESGQSSDSTLFRKPYTIIKFTPVDGGLLHPGCSMYQHQSQGAYYHYHDYPANGQQFSSAPTYDQNGYIVYPEPMYVVSQPQQVNSHMPMQPPRQMMPMRYSQPAQGYYSQYVQPATHAPSYGYQSKNQYSPQSYGQDAYNFPRYSQTQTQSHDMYSSYAVQKNSNAKVQDDGQYSYVYYPTETAEYSCDDTYNYYYYDYPTDENANYDQGVAQGKEYLPCGTVGYDRNNQNSGYYDSHDATHQYSQYNYENYAGANQNLTYAKSNQYESFEKQGTYDVQNPSFYPTKNTGSYLPNSSENQTAYFAANRMPLDGSVYGGQSDYNTVC